MDSIAASHRTANRLAIATMRSFDFASAEYLALFRRAQCSAFQHPDWLVPFYERLVKPPHADAAVVVGRRATTGELALVVPLLQRRIGESTLAEYASLGVCDYALPVVCPDLIAECRRDAALKVALRNALGQHDALRIAPVPSDGLDAWAALIGQPPTPLGFGAHAVACDEPYAEWHARTRSPRRLRDIGRKRRQLERTCGALRFEIVRGATLREAFAAARCFRKGRFTDDPLQDEAFFEFYIDVAMRGAASGFARTYRLSCGSETIAVLFGITHGRRFCYLILGGDYGAYGRYSPGMIMFDAVMEQWFEGGGQVFDFTIGDEPFKAAFGCGRTPMYQFMRTNTAHSASGGDRRWQD